MAAFERIPSGLPGLDQALDHIRLGDNVVWQVSSVGDFQALARPFAAQARADHRRLIYLRFAQHEPLLSPAPGLTTLSLDPELGFEAFTSAVHAAIADAGRDAFYVFDCLSELEAAWSADLMMGNFFRVTCPYLFELDTVAWFPLLRNRHSFQTVARIRETTQLLLDLYPAEQGYYLHPLKVWNRYAPTMFLPHRLDPGADGSCRPLTDGLELSRFYARIGQEHGNREQQDLDSWDRYFLRCRREAGGPEADRARLSRGARQRLLGLTGTLETLAEEVFSLEDLLGVKDRLIGSGKIGGKAVGMLLARRLAEARLPDLALGFEPHDSHYIGTDVFYTYLVHNGLWKLRLEQRADAGYYSRAEALKACILQGRFPELLRERFLRLLEYYGQSPLIVRSSSLLEDSFGHAFSGKYESVFCANQGSPEDRLSAFENAVRRVFASTMDESALAYRRDRGLEAQEEQMALLVQRVSGSLWGRWFLPAAAGVAFSHNAWRWSPQLNPSAGVVRLVAGLGTRAVDRTGGDYPRLVSLDPQAPPAYADTDLARYCQRHIDLIDLEAGGLGTQPVETLEPLLPSWLGALLFERDTEAEARLAERGLDRRLPIATCRGLAALAPFRTALDRLLQVLQNAYGVPVDTEFTVNFDPAGGFMLNLLQCRPLQAAQNAASAAVPAHRPDEIFLQVQGALLGPSAVLRLQRLVWVDPLAYYALPLERQYAAARELGRLNRTYKAAGLTAALISPGRLGTSSPELGLPVSFAEINGFALLCEQACLEAGYRPELSYGSHFFQDLVEAGIVYAALDEQAVKTFPRWDLLPLSPGVPEAGERPDPGLAGVIQVWADPKLQVWVDSAQARLTALVVK